MARARFGFVMVCLGLSVPKPVFAQTPNAAAAVLRATWASESGEPSVAREEFSRAIVFDPTSPWLALRVPVGPDGLRLDAVAVRALELAPRSARAWTAAAVAFRRDGDLKRAERAFRTAIRFGRACPAGSEIADLGLAGLLFDRGRFPEVTRVLQRARRRCPVGKDHGADTALLSLLAEGRYNAAVGRIAAARKSLELVRKESLRLSRRKLEAEARRSLRAIAWIERRVEPSVEPAERLEASLGAALLPGWLPRENVRTPTDFSPIERLRQAESTPAEAFRAFLDLAEAPDDSERQFVYGAHCLTYNESLGRAILSRIAELPAAADDDGAVFRRPRSMATP